MSDESAGILRDRYQNIIDQMSDALMIDDLNGRVVFANRAFRELFAIDEALVSDMMLEDYVAPEYRPQLRERHDRRVRGESVPSRFEYVGLRSTGERRFLEVSVIPVIEAGRVTGTQSLIRDLTEEKRAENDLAAARDHLRQILESLPVAVTLLAADATVLEWNAAAERMFGWARDEVIGCPYPLVEGAQQQQSARMLLQAIESGRSWSGLETTRRHKDGTEVEVAVWTRPLQDARGERYASIGVLVDATERKQLERRVLQSERMSALGQLAGGIAHDFNNLLTAFVGYPDLIRISMRRGEPIEEHLGAMQEVAERSIDMTRALLTFSRGQVSKRTPLVVSEVVADLRPMLDWLVPDNVRLDVDLDRHLPRVLVDRSNLEQVVVNLVVNACDAMDDGGRVSIRTETAALDTAEAARIGMTPGEVVTLVVQDDGAGMDRQTAARVFEPFFTTKTAKGTGLGLATVYGIVEQHGGHITLETSPGEGASFSVYLSVTHEEAPVAGGPEAASRGKLPPCRVLLVDDDEAARRVAEMTLRTVGHQVAVASDGGEALDLLERESFDVMVSDILMPNVSGVDLQRAMSKRGYAIPVVWISGYSPDELDGQFEGRLSPDDVLQKPFRPIDLLRRLADVVLDPG